MYRERVVSVLSDIAQFVGPANAESGRSRRGLSFSTRHALGTWLGTALGVVRCEDSADHSGMD
eukprot:7534748-Pyramimonas_sp.AAC.1